MKSKTLKYHRSKKLKKGRSIKKNKLLSNSKKYFLSVCARCQRKLEDDAKCLGGTHNGVVCINHRSCLSCWFESEAKGKRNHESKLTKNIPLVDKPFNNRKPKCPGCFNKVPPFKIPPDVGTINHEGVIELDL